MDDVLTSGVPYLIPKLPYAAPPAPGPKLGLGRQSRLGSGRGPGTSSGVRRRVRPRPAEVRHQGLADQQHQPGVRHGPAGLRPPSGRIRRGLGTRVLLTCLGPADPRYWGGSYRPSQSALPWKRPKGLASFHERSRGLIQEIFLWCRSADEAAMRHANWASSLRRTHQQAGRMSCN